MSQPPDLPQRPEDIAAWVQSLSSEEAMDLARSVAGGGLGQATFEQHRKPPIELPNPPEQPSLLTVHITLDDSEPLVWRKLVVRGDLSLPIVHQVVQVAMGWTDSHLHRFFTGGPWEGPYFLTDWDLEEGEQGTHEGTVRLDQLLCEVGDTLGYSYDFGDGWEHTLRLERIGPAASPRPGDDAADDPLHGAPAACLDGAAACPPEDVGGLHGHAEMATWVRSGFDPASAPSHIDPDESEELRGWLPPGWDPDAFSAEETTRELQRLTTRDNSALAASMPHELRHTLLRLDPATDQMVQDWLAHEGWESPTPLSVDDAAAMTRRWRTVLDAVGDGVKLTAAGWLPPSLVKTILTELDLDDVWIGKGNREDLTQPVADLRADAQRFGLLRKTKGHLEPTARGRALRDNPVGLWRQVASRLPVEKDEFGRLAGLVYLLAVGGGATSGGGSDLDDSVCRVLSAAGWRLEDGRPLAPYALWRTAYDTRRILHDRLDLAAGLNVDARLTGELARTALRRTTAPDA